MRPETKYKGCIALAAIGDALGWITEFERDKNSIFKKYADYEIKQFYTWEKTVGGRFNGYLDRMEEGAYSDDTQLMLAVYRSIRSGGDVDMEYFSKVELALWLMYQRGGGRTIKNAAKKIQRKSARWNNNFFTFKVGQTKVDYRKTGANGAAMRIAPIALANLGNFEKTKFEIFRNTIVTHGHPNAMIGAVLYGYLIDTVIKFRPENFEGLKVVTDLGQQLNQILDISSVLSDPDIFKWLRAWEGDNVGSFNHIYDRTIQETQENLRNVYRSLSNEWDDIDMLKKLGCFNRETKGSGTATVLAGLFLACRYSEDPLNGIYSAVNAIGADTDSVASFTGGILGALHGNSIVPNRLKGVQDYEYLLEVAEHLVSISEGSNSVEIGRPEDPSIRFIDTIDADIFKLYQNVYFTPLGRGMVTNINRQDTITSGRYNLIIDVEFEAGQSCRFSKLFNSKSLISSQKTENVSSKKVIGDYYKRQKIEEFMDTLESNQRKTFIEILNDLFGIKW